MRQKLAFSSLSVDASGSSHKAGVWLIAELTIGWRSKADRQRSHCGRR
jgi:hypothetical protein